jgi:hypothetical protein
MSFGVIRDKALVQTNEYVIFSEVMENCALHGVESLNVEMVLCPDGSSSAAVDVTGGVSPQGR